MSHTVSIPAQVHSQEGLRRACARQRLDAPQFGVTLPQAHHTNTARVALRKAGWPVLSADLESGQVYHDADYRQEVDAFLQAYGVETAKLAFELQGVSYTETVLENGLVELVTN